MKRATFLTAAVVSALALNACQKKEAVQDAAAPAPTTAPAAPAIAEATAPVSVEEITPIEPLIVTAPATPGTPSTATLLWGVTLTNMYEVQAGKIAEKKAQSPAVKEFAKTMGTDHPAMTQQMVQLFKASNEKIPTALGPRGKSMIDALNAARPEDFDKLYLQQQQAAQKAELSLLKDYAAGGENAEVKPVAAKAAISVQAHLDKVRALQAAAK
jgi:putative membrane protein